MERTNFMKSNAHRLILLVSLLLAGCCFADTNTFTVATYNLENWLLMERRGGTNSPKPVAERNAVTKVLAGIQPDVLGVEEMGSTNELADLRTRLEAQGLNYPHTEWIQGADPNRHVALLSRFPIVERFPHTNDTYTLNDQPVRINRGILDVRIQVNPAYSFRALVVHLKSKRQTETGDQEYMRREEAKLLRAKIENILAQDPNENFIVMGDFNDTPRSPAITELTGTNNHNLFLLHPRDSKGYDTTHFWKAHREFSRIDYIIASPGMSNEFVTGSAHIADPHGWLDASDHRAVHAQFYTTDRGTNRPARVTKTK